MVSTKYFGTILQQHYPNGPKFSFSSDTRPEPNSMLLKNTKMNVAFHFPYNNENLYFFKKFNAAMIYHLSVIVLTQHALSTANTRGNLPVTLMGTMHEVMIWESVFIFSSGVGSGKIPAQLVCLSSVEGTFGIGHFGQWPRATTSESESTGGAT